MSEEFVTEPEFEGTPVEVVTSPLQCFKCGGPMPEKWFFVKWCDGCLDAHNAMNPVENLEAEVLAEMEEP